MSGPVPDGRRGDAGDGWLLALHSSGGGFGVGLLPWPPPQEILAAAASSGLASGDPTATALEPLLHQARLEHFATDRDLSNRLLPCLEAVLPAAQWPRLRRLAVAIGPGGFTSTRLTVVLARTLAQQDDLPLDGISSFLLIARRLCHGAEPPAAPFRLVQELPRRGRVAGLYGLDPAAPGGVAELELPRLHEAQRVFSGEWRPAEPRLPEDVAELLAISACRALRGVSAPWQAVLPIYPTSPVPLD